MTVFKDIRIGSRVNIVGLGSDINPLTHTVSKKENRLGMRWFETDTGYTVSENDLLSGHVKVTSVTGGREPSTNLYISDNLLKEVLKRKVKGAAYLSLEELLVLLNNKEK